MKPLWKIIVVIITPHLISFPPNMKVFIKSYLRSFNILPILLKIQNPIIFHLKPSSFDQDVMKLSVENNLTYHKHIDEMISNDIESTEKLVALKDKIIDSLIKKSADSYGLLCFCRRSEIVDL